MNSKNELIAWFDLETTGVYFDEDRIISMSIVKTDQKGNVLGSWSSKFNPEGVKIKPDAFKAHGITDEELLGCPYFKDKAKEIADFMEGCDIGGHNVIKFDVPLLIKEMDMAGVYFSVEKRRIVDTLSIYRALHASTLHSIYKEYYKTEPTYPAHDALGDTFTSIDIYKAMSNVHQITKEDIDKYCFNQFRIDMTGLFVFGTDGKIEFGKGKHKGTPVENADINYLRWVFEDSDFPMETKSIANRCYKYLIEKRVKELHNQ